MNEPANTAVFLPFYGEFGHFIMEHIRYVHGYQIERKIVLCEEGQQSLFPTANGFRFDWWNPIPDDKRQQHNSNCARYKEAVLMYNTILRERLAKDYPGAVIVRPGSKGQPWYDCRWHVSDSIKFRPSVEPALEACDVVMAPRLRGHDSRNFMHWSKVIAACKAKGLSVGIVGHPKGTMRVEGIDAKGWDHPGGIVAGMVDLLSRCKMYLGTDTGVSHLAALMDAPMVIFRYDGDDSPDMCGIMHRATKGFIKQLPSNVWHRPQMVIDGLFEAMGI